MKAVLGMGGYLAATVGASLTLLGRWIPRPQQAAPLGPFGVLQAFHHCPNCARDTAHIIHSTAARTCQDCQHTTHPGATP